MRPDILSAVHRVGRRYIGTIMSTIVQSEDTLVSPIVRKTARRQHYVKASRMLYTDNARTWDYETSRTHDVLSHHRHHRRHHYHVTIFIKTISFVVRVIIRRRPSHDVTVIVEWILPTLQDLPRTLVGKLTYLRASVENTIAPV